MKNIFNLLPVFFLLIFASCKKCKDCSCTQSITQTDQSDSTYSLQYTNTVEFSDVCDEDLDAIEGTTTFTQSSISGLYSESVEQSCDCK